MSHGTLQSNPEEGARNLLLGCVGVQPGERILIVCEEDHEQHYCSKMSAHVDRVARELGARPKCLATPVIDNPGAFPEELILQMSQAEHTVFLNRMADHARFIKIPGKSSKTICYALDEGLLGSAFATLPHKLMMSLLTRLERELDAAKQWRITCPLGSDAKGTFEWNGDEDEDFTFGLFPVTTFKPVPCGTMSGKVALAHWLIPGGKANYEPAFLPISKPVMAHVEMGRLCELEGDPESVKPIEDHREMVAQKFGIDRDFVHSWHVGMNPHTFSDRPADEDLGRWGAISFASPRYLHFHTCGDYAPGEIAWSIFDPTVTIDGVDFWKDGEFVWLKRSDNAALISEFPGAECIYEMRRDLGVGF